MARKSKPVAQGPLHARTVLFNSETSRAIVTRLNAEEVCLETHRPGDAMITQFAIFTLAEARDVATALLEMADEEPET